ncbi:nitric oxide reductase transcriptional regulator NorR [Mangrovibacter plantisponsor]|uniref:Anaerobic nitric oxide reductase transcription regulator n=1 Tax=Mangrovibacter plantisponsor TaxID=451513 RepID=A0A317Q5K0_9ENTR|nr:nitric oxide reductase transcriptional regulator NorR [Mangrovibacter plantisponsor]PWW11499.1 anaerobic nitric oxide reductase transcription regulator [Mangrovibacter plantisponsor]
MPLQIRQLADIAGELNQGGTCEVRFQRLVNLLQRVLVCDACALLLYEHRQFRPLAIHGLSPDVLGRRFDPASHPRLEAIARAGNVVRFPADSGLPDPYDGLIPGQEQLKVHACVGLPLFDDERLVGALTLDSMNAVCFDHLSNDELWLIAVLAANTLKNALLIKQLESQSLSSNEAALPPLSSTEESTEIVGLSVPVTQLRHEISVVAASDLTVLINGETGTGKELVARAIHEGSDRAHQPMVYLNCAALPESVAESELFGHVKGAFTGAISDRQGKFERANNGTLFLDEIGELPLSLQAKLLRVLQYGDIQRVGDDKNSRVDVRVLAATNRDLKAEVLAGRFRADLFHRLSVFPVRVPPLRERGEDIALLAGFFCERCRGRFGLQSVALSPDSLAVLSAHTWPGNVRELEHAIYRAVLIARATRGDAEVMLTPAHFSLTSTQPANAVAFGEPSGPALLTCSPLRAATDDFQRNIIRQALNSHQHNWAAAARALSLDVANLHRLAKRLGLK